MNASLKVFLYMWCLPTDVHIFMCMHLYMCMCAHVYWLQFYASDCGWEAGAVQACESLQARSMCVNPSVCLCMCGCGYDCTP